MTKTPWCSNQSHGGSATGTLSHTEPNLSFYQFSELCAPLTAPSSKRIFVRRIDQRGGTRPAVDYDDILQFDKKR
ncbi:jg5571 [Pararge aegeria aegeria]|uniref:Jg5571 protein n=1 Tax=Pararge aegeria aegeria TaxID=348720 RepID=A0A8S4QJV7_9NEOP|nr:jg5571 [Pararge aegeria aegeria]